MMKKNYQIRPPLFLLIKLCLHLELEVEGLEEPEVGGLLPLGLFEGTLGSHTEAVEEDTLAVEEGILAEVADSIQAEAEDTDHRQQEEAGHTAVHKAEELLEQRAVHRH